MSRNARLVALRLQGFKSFAERTVVEFAPGINAVVGPNGSGKSNLADALRWASAVTSMPSNGRRILFNRTTMELPQHVVSAANRASSEVSPAPSSHSCSG